MASAAIRVCLWERIQCCLDEPYGRRGCAVKFPRVASVLPVVCCSELRTSVPFPGARGFSGRFHFSPAGHLLK